MTVYCDYCGHKAELVDDTVIYGHSYGHKAYLCRYCGAYVGCHGRSDKPMGRLADAGLRRKKMEAHAAFDPLWKRGPFRGRRKDAYAWLAGKMAICRITAWRSPVSAFTSLMRSTSSPKNSIRMATSFI